jgi:pilus assembly protein CpaB
MKSKTMILMILAIGCGLVASILTSRMLAQQGTQTDVEKVAVLVAKQKIGLGTTIKEPEKMFTEKLFIKGQEPKGAVSSYDELKGKRLNKPINAEVHVTADDIADEKNGGLEGVIRPGHRAITIKVGTDTGTAGFVRAHSRVDVVSTVRGGDANSIAKIILENMLVLAVDQQRQRDGDKDAQIASTVTLEAKPDEAEKLTMAAAIGELRLLLRSPEDEVAAQTRGARPSDVLKGKSGGDTKDDGDPGKTETASAPVAPKVPDVPVAPAPTPEPPKVVEAPKPPKTHTLTVINGESQTRAVYVEKEGDSSTEITRSEPGAAPTKKPEAPAPAPETAPPPAAEPTKEKAPDGSAATEPKPRPKTGMRTPGQKVGS